VLFEQRELLLKDAQGFWQIVHNLAVWLCLIGLEKMGHSWRTSFPAVLGPAHAYPLRWSGCWPKSS
jgi:hypothetical protein